MQLTLWQIALLAAVQGVTEFLPISSSGHLVILADWIADGNTEALDVSDLNIVLHLGTLLSILVFYCQRVWRLLGEDRRVLSRLALGTVPAVVVGLPLKMKFEYLLESPVVAGVLLCVTGVVLIWASRAKPGKIAYTELGYGRTLLIGISQAAAVLPGLSRSGATIATGMRLGMTPQSAATFSFLLAIPAIGGAGVLEVASLMSTPHDATTPLSYLLVGALLSFLVGLVSLWWLVRWIERGKLQLFAFWCIPLGLLVLTWQLA